MESIDSVHSIYCNMHPCAVAVAVPVAVPKAVQSNAFNCLETESDTEDSVKTESREPRRVLVHRKKLWSEWESDDEDE